MKGRVLDSDRNGRTARFGGCGRKAISLILVLAAPLGGCVPLAHSECTGVAFSRDGRWIAHAWSDQIVTGFGMAPVANTNSQYLRYAPAADPGDCRSILIHRDVLMVPGFPSDAVRGIAFSPDSEYLAVMTRKGIIVIELASGKHWRLHLDGERPNSLAWVGADKLAYSADAAKRIGRYWQRRRAVYRHEIKPKGERTRLFRARPVLMQGPFADESWSPDGRYLVLLDPHEWGLVTLVDTVTGKVTQPIERVYEGLGAVWRPGTTTVLCINLSRFGGGSRLQWHLLDARTGSVTDLTERACAVLRGHADARFWWTADGKGLVANWQEGACVICPETWNTVALKTARADPFPVPGWLLTWKDGKAYAVDYQGVRRVKISESEGWGISPDGKRIAEVDEKGQVTGRQLDLPGTAPGAEKDEPAGAGTGRER